MSDVEQQAVIEALKAVRTPQGASLVDSGMLSGLTVKGRHVLLTIDIDPDRQAEMEPLKQAAEEAAESVPGVLSVTAMLTAQVAGKGAPAAAAPRPSPGPAPDQAATGPAQPGPAGGRGILPAGIGAVIAVASGKGGVGKSTCAVNLALALAAKGQRVGLLDADIYGPSVPRLLSISGKPNSPDGKSLDPMARFGLKTMSIGFLVDEATPMIWRGPMVQSALTQMLKDVNWGTLDVLVVDMPPGTGDAQLTMAQQVPLAGAVIISTPQDIALIDARKGLNMFRKVDVPVLGLIENMSYFTCGSCGARHDIFGHGGARAEAERLGCAFLGEIPLEVAIRTASDEGHPIVALEPQGSIAGIYGNIADAVLAGLQRGPGRTAPEIVMEG